MPMHATKRSFLFIVRILIKRARCTPCSLSLWWRAWLGKIKQKVLERGARMWTTAKEGWKKDRRGEFVFPELEQSTTNLSRMFFFHFALHLYFGDPLRFSFVPISFSQASAWNQDWRRWLVGSLEEQLEKGTRPLRSSMLACSICPIRTEALKLASQRGLAPLFPVSCP